MRLSQAIRLGIKEIPAQAFKAYKDEDGGGCALFTALVGACLTSKDKRYAGMSYGKLCWTFPDVGMVANCPETNCDMSPMEVYILITHLNDSHVWTREQIASWLEVEIEGGMVPAKEIHSMLESPKVEVSL